jgi:hypothetical protein
MAASPVEKEFLEKTKILEDAFRSNLISGLLLRQQLQQGTVTAGDLQRHNVASALTQNAQLTIRDAFKRHGITPPLPPLPPLFFPKNTKDLWFEPKNPKQVVGPNDFDVFLPSNITEEFFPVSVQVQDDNLGVAFPLIPVIIAGITIAVTVAVIAKVALETSRDKELGRIELEAIKQQAQLSQYVAEARQELVNACVVKGGSFSSCASEAQKTIDSVPKDLHKIGRPKFESNWTSWLLGGILLGAVGVVGSAVYIKRKSRAEA